MRPRAAAALRSDGVSRLTARSVSQYRISPKAIRAPFADSITPLSSASFATAAELFASLFVRYKFVAMTMHSKTPDKMMRRERMVRRDITIDISRRPSQLFRHRRHRPRRVHWMNVGGVGVLFA